MLRQVRYIVRHSLRHSCAVKKNQMLQLFLRLLSLWMSNNRHTIGCSYGINDNITTRVNSLIDLYLHFKCSNLKHNIQGDYKNWSKIKWTINVKHAPDKSINITNVYTDWENCFLSITVKTLKFVRMVTKSVRLYAFTKFNIKTCFTQPISMK